MNIRMLGVGERRGVRMKIDSGEGKKERQTPGPSAPWEISRIERAESNIIKTAKLGGVKIRRVLG